MLLERRNLNKGLGGEVAGAQIAECGELFAELEESLFRADGACAIFLCCTISEAPVSGWSKDEGVRDRRLPLGGRHLLLSQH